MNIIVAEIPVDYLPLALRANRNNEDMCPIPLEQRNAPQAASNVTGIFVVPEKVRAPVARFKNVRQLTGKIEDYAKNNMQIYEMVMVAFSLSLTIVSSRNAKGAASRLREGDVGIPQIPQQSMTTNGDHSSKKQRKKTSSDCMAHNTGGGGGHGFASAGSGSQQDDMAMGQHAAHGGGAQQQVGWGEVHTGWGGQQDDIAMGHHALEIWWW